MNESKVEKELILEVKDLRTYFYGSDDVVWKILDGINFKLHRGETLGIMGPSGVGKSVLAHSILKLIKWPGKIEGGEIFFKGKNLFNLEEEDFDDLRGREICLVMQNSSNSLDPLRDMTYATSQPYKVHTEDEHENIGVRRLRNSRPHRHIRPGSQRGRKRSHMRRCQPGCIGSYQGFTRHVESSAGST